MIYIAAFVAVGFVLFCRKTKNPERTAIMGFLTGGAALLAAYFAGGLFGVEIPVNLFTAALSLFGGVPFVIFLVIYSVL